jgi:hypothetical protein
VFEIGHAVAEAADISEAGLERKKSFVENVVLLP